MITIYDIANATGVSAPTVSKALNGTGHLSDKTREFILQKSGEEPGEFLGGRDRGDRAQRERYGSL